jgi:HAD superfamily hydrolase (TIGR01509 family)
MPCAPPRALPPRPATFGVGRRAAALLFDFDGLLVDTEVPAFEAWQSVYAAHNVALTLECWAPVVGTLGHPFDPFAHLAELVGEPLDRADILALRDEREAELLAATGLRPGVEDYLHDAERLGLRRAVVTSNNRGWVRAHLQRLGVERHFALIEAADGDASRAKPRPTLYLDALARLAVNPDEVIVFEDSPNGVAAAKSAGAFCVAVPNAITAPLDLSAADLLLGSMADMPLAEVLSRAAQGPQIAGPPVA